MVTKEKTLQQQWVFLSQTACNCEGLIREVGLPDTLPITMTSNTTKWCNSR